jgi:hypothetical protein
MSTHVYLLRDGVDEKHQRKVRAVQALINAEEDIPQSLLDYFGIYDESEFQADTSGLEVKDNKEHPSISEWRNDYSEGYEVDLLKLPTGVTKIRFSNSW